MRNFYAGTHTEYKCLPEHLPPELLNIVKKAVECVQKTEKIYADERLTPKEHKKQYHLCFQFARDEVEDLMMSVDPKINYCPRNKTEKTYEINVTTKITKTFQFNIDNGVDAKSQQIQVTAVPQESEERHVADQGQDFFYDDFPTYRKESGAHKPDEDEDNQARLRNPPDLDLDPEGVHKMPKYFNRNAEEEEQFRAMDSPSASYFKSLGRYNHMNKP